MGHIGYYQFPTGITAQQRISNPGNFDRLGNTPTTTIAAYGYHPLQAAIDLRGTNVKEYTNALALDEALTSPTEAAANAIMTYAIATRTATAVTASTIDNLHDALYVSRLVTSRTGNIARTWSVTGQTIDTAGSLTIAGQAFSVGGTFSALTQGTTVGTLTLPANNTIDFTAAYGTITWTTTAPTILISDGRITGNLTGLANNATYRITGGEITNLTIDSAATGITIEIPLTVEGRAAFVTANSHVTVIATEEFNTISIPTPVAGRYGIVQTIGGTETVHTAPTSFAANDTVSFQIGDRTFAANDTLQIYVKYDSVVTAAGGAANIVYEHTRTDYTFSSGDLNVPVPAPVTSVLVGSATVSPTDLTFATSVDGTNASVVITRTGASASTEGLLVSPAAANGTAITIANDDQVFDSWFRNRGASGAVLTYQSNDGVQWDNTLLTFSSGNTNAGSFRLQHTFEQWSNAGTGTFTLSRSGSPEIFGNPVAAASLSQVTTAAELGVNRSSRLNEVDTNVTDIETLVNEIVVDTREIQTDVDAMRTNRLLGLKPQSTKPEEAS